MNPNLELLQPYPFEKLRALLSEAPANNALEAINLSIGEPRHPPPAQVMQSLAESLLHSQQPDFRDSET